MNGVFRTSHLTETISTVEKKRQTYFFLTFRPNLSIKIGTVTAREILVSLNLYNVLRVMALLDVT